MLLVCYGNVSDLDPVSVESAGPLMLNKGDTLELQCKTKSSDEYTLSWMKVNYY